MHRFMLRNLIASITLIALLPTLAATARAAGNIHWLKVDGLHIVNAKGKVVRLVGMGISPIHSEWRDGGYRSLEDAVKYYRGIGCNAMRVAVYRNHDYDQHIDLIRRLGIEGFIAKEIDPQVQLVIRKNMYVILDWHNYANQDGLPGITEEQRRDYWYHTVIPLWRAIARRYRNEPCVAIYELWNEPTWPGYALGDKAQIPDLRAWYKACIQAIRQEDRRHILMVSDYNAGWGIAETAMWIQGDKLLPLDTISPAQIIYSHHASAISELRRENEAADDFSKNYNVPIAYGEVELQPDVDRFNKLLGPVQEVLISKTTERQLRSQLYQAWLGWRTGMNDWQKAWAPLRALTTR